MILTDINIWGSLRPAENEKGYACMEFKLLSSTARDSSVIDKQRHTRLTSLFLS